MSYSDSAEWASGRAGCSCAEEVLLLQGKLAEVHSKLIRQIEICQQQQEALMGLAHRGSTHKASYDTFGGRQNISDDYEHAANCDQSSESYFIKNELLQADLEAMRRRVLSEITEKNKLLEQMGQLKKKHRRQMGNQVKKFQGLEIVYQQLIADRQSPDARSKQKTSKVEAETQRLTQEVQELTVKLHRQREKVKKLQKINDILTDQVKRLNEDQKQEGKEKENRRRGEANCQEDQLREIGNMKQQINRLNRNLALRESQSRQRSSSRAAESQEESGGETKLVGLKAWGRKGYS